MTVEAHICIYFIYRSIVTKRDCDHIFVYRFGYRKISLIVAVFLVLIEKMCLCLYNIISDF